MNSIFKWLIKSDYVRAQIMGFVRHIVTTVGVGLVAKGYADDSLVQGAAGLATAIVGFYLAQLDVKKVDEKIQVALATPVPSQAVTTTTIVTSPDPTPVQAILTTPSAQGLTPDQEREETELLNKLQAIRPGVDSSVNVSKRD